MVHTRIIENLVHKVFDAMFQGNSVLAYVNVNCIEPLPLYVFSFIFLSSITCY